MTLRNLASALRERIRLPRNEDGSVAIEFAFIAPVLIIMYFGLFQVSMIIMEDRRVSHSTSVLGDLVTREAVLDEDAVSNVLQGATEVLGISNDNTLVSSVSMQIVSLRMVDDGSGGTTVNTIGSAVINESVLPAEWPQICVSDIDKRLLNTSSGAVVARVGYVFNMRSNSDESTGGKIGKGYVDLNKGGILLQEQIIMKPRGPVDIPFTDPSDPTQGLHFKCEYNSTGAVSCGTSENVNNSDLTCN